MQLLAPGLGSLARNLRINAELIGTADKRLLSRREVDIALRIEDDPGEDMVATDLVRAIRLGAIDYAVYCKAMTNPDEIPWAGVVEGPGRTTGANAQNKVAGREGVRYRVNRFEELCQLAAGGAAKAMLPKIVAGRNSALVAISETVLQQPLWLLYHRQDEDTGYLKVLRERIVEMAREALPG